LPPIPHSKKTTGGVDAFSEVDEEMLNNMKEKLQDEMGIM
jgi:hypothetical protein